ncbi:MAG TPA: hypothetical protein VGG02_09255 [Chthoniobacterales bacterium]
MDQSEPDRARLTMANSIFRIAARSLEKGARIWMRASMPSTVAGVRASGRWFSEKQKRQAVADLPFR